MPTNNYEVTDEQWNLISPHILNAKTGRPPKDNRKMFNAILWMARTGAPWRCLPVCYGSYQTVYSRFCKWRDDGTLHKLFELLCSDADMETICIDSTLVKAHSDAFGQKKSNGSSD